MEREHVAELLDAGKQSRVNERTAGTVANVVLATAALGAAVVILRVPKLRRVALGLAATVLTTQLPVWLRAQVTEAWHASSPTGRV